MTSPLDSLTTPGTLRYAVAHAGNGDRIVLKADALAAGITLTQGELLLTQQNLTIDTKAGNDPVTISGDNLSRIFELATGASVTMHNLTIADGNAQTGHPADPHEGRGGGVVVDEGATLTINDSTVTDNSAPRLGGGIADYGTLTVNNSAVTDNHALGTYGGGIAVFSGAPFSAPFSASLTVKDSTVSGNTAFQNGGGIADVASTVTLNNCDVTGNSAYLYNGGGLNNHGGNLTISHSRVSGNSSNGSGGGIYNFAGASATVSDSSLSGNSAFFGGGICNVGTLMLSNSTLSGNSAFFGGGICNYGTLTLGNSTTLSGNSAVEGGGVSNYGTLMLSNSTLSGNSAGDGGGICNYGTLMLSNSTLSGNSASGDGGGIYNFGTLSLDLSDFLNNTAGLFGGGVANFRTMTVDHSDFLNNSAVISGGGIFTSLFGASLTISHSTVSGNGADDIFGVYVDGGHNTIA